MRFRPCIDIHNGKVKQIVGGSLQDQGDQAQENYVAEQDAPFFARLYQSRGILFVFYRQCFFYLFITKFFCLILIG